MTPADIRARLEDGGAQFLINPLTGDVQMGFAPSASPFASPFGDPMDEELANEYYRHRTAIAAHVRQFPCRGCGRSPFAAACGECPLRDGGG